MRVRVLKPHILPGPSERSHMLVCRVGQVLVFSLTKYEIASIMHGASLACCLGIAYWHSQSSPGIQVAI